MITYLGCTVYVVTISYPGMVEGANPVVRPALTRDLGDPAVKLGCLSHGRTVPLSPAERAILVRAYVRGVRS